MAGERDKIEGKADEAMGTLREKVGGTTGDHDMEVSTANLASGLYNVKITTDKGTTTERLSVVK